MNVRIGTSSIGQMGHVQDKPSIVDILVDQGHREPPRGQPTAAPQSSQMREAYCKEALEGPPAAAEPAPPAATEPGCLEEGRPVAPGQHLERMLVEALRDRRGAEEGQGHYTVGPAQVASVAAGCSMDLR